MSEQVTQEQIYEEQPAPRWWLWAGLGLIGLVILILLLIWVVGGRRRPLKSFTTPTPVGELVRVDNQALLVTFDQLNENPYEFLNRTIRVSGDYVPVERPSCTPYNGPAIDWALVSGNLQLDAKGYRLVRRLIPPGQSLTVEGVWRLYEGPLGCGKEPETDRAWYLAVTQILQPNPLPNAGNLVASGGINVLTTPLPQGSGLVTPLPAGTVIPTSTPTPTSSLTATPSPSATSTAAVTIGTGTATPSATPTETLAPGTTRRPTQTPAPTNMATPTPTPTPTLTGTPATATPRPTQPSLPTSTQDPDDYPGPPDDTPTPDDTYP